jgi:prepilin-type N-terminal cleavage/methylation domain-containing protein
MVRLVHIFLVGQIIELVTASSLSKGEELQKRGFTLIEMLVVVFIVALLASIILISVNRGRQDARNAKRKADLGSIKTAVEMYRDRNSNYIITMIDGSATGGSPASTGYFNYQGYTHSIASGLVDWGFLDPAPSDPLNPGITTTDGNSYAIYATLENPNDADSDGYDDSSSSGSTCQSHWPNCQSNYRIGNGG